MSFVLAIDQGTSSTKSIIFDENANAVSKGHVALLTNYYENGFVEQDPESIFQNVKDSVSLCLQNFIEAGHQISQIVSCGISNQRETFIIWDKNGKALAPAVVWACKRSVDICAELISKGHNELIRSNTGLIIDPYFSATKLLWLLRNDANLKEKLDMGEIYFGTVDTWLLYKMSNGRSYHTDYTNAHRTLLFNINTLQWDKELLKIWGLEKLNLPEVYASSANFGTWEFAWVENNSDTENKNYSKHRYSKIKTGTVNSQAFSIPITSLIGDSHAAAFGETCFEAGTAKVTLGTGSSILMNIGSKPIHSKAGMLTTICWSTQDKVAYALEGAIISCGSTIEWIKNELELFKDVSETAAMANALADNGGVYLIPAFSGLGAPHWQMNRKASIEGMTFGTTKNHIVRAALESIPYQIKDVIVAMKTDMGTDIKGLAVNGGLTKNNFVMSFLVDLLRIPLSQQIDADISALGAAYLSGLQSGIFKDLTHLKAINAHRIKIIEPDLANNKVIAGYNGWKKALKSQ